MDRHPAATVSRRSGPRPGAVDQAPVHQCRGPIRSSTVEWELRDARIGHGDHVAFEQRERRVPQELVAERDQHRRPEVLPRPARLARARALGQADDRPRRRHDHRLGPRGRLLRERRGRQRLQPRADPHPAPPDGRVQLARLVQRRLRGAARSAAPASSSPSRTRWSRSSTGTPRRGTIFRGGSGSGINLSNIRGSMEPLAKGGTASGPVSFMRGADSWAGTIKSGGKTRRAAKMVVLDIDHPDIREFIWCKAKEEDKAAALRDAGFDMSIDGDGFFSIQYQNANNSVRVTDEFMQAVEDDARLAPDRAHDRRADRRADPRARADAARSPRPPGAAPTRACSTTRRSTSGTPARTAAASTRRTRAASTCTSTTRPATSPR